MANLTVSTRCPMRCSFCFAGADRAGGRSADPPFLPLDRFDARLAFLDRSAIDQVRLIGGEPTAHPQFPELIRRSRGRHVVVFTNGLMPPSALRALCKLPDGSGTVIVNSGATRNPGGPSAVETRRRATVLHQLGTRALLSHTIFRPDVDLAPLLGLVAETGARPVLRVGLAQPILDGRNTYLHPKHYLEVGRRLAAFAVDAVRRGVRLEFDCGFVPCLFTTRQLRTMSDAGVSPAWRCNPVLDIGIDDIVSHCLPLAGVADLAFEAGSVAADLRQRFETRTHPFRVAGIHAGCQRCEQRDVCPGGCLAVVLRRFRTRPIRLGPPAPAHAHPPANSIRPAPDTTRGYVDHDR